MDNRATHESLRGGGSGGGTGTLCCQPPSTVNEMKQSGGGGGQQDGGGVAVGVGKERVREATCESTSVQDDGTDSDSGGGGGGGSSNSGGGGGLATGCILESHLRPTLSMENGMEVVRYVRNGCPESERARMCEMLNAASGPVFARSYRKAWQPCSQTSARSRLLCLGDPRTLFETRFSRDKTRVESLVTSGMIFRFTYKGQFWYGVIDVRTTGKCVAGGTIRGGGKSIAKGGDNRIVLYFVLPSHVNVVPKGVPSQARTANMLAYFPFDEESTLRAIQIRVDRVDRRIARMLKTPKRNRGGGSKTNAAAADSRLKKRAEELRARGYEAAQKGRRYPIFPSSTMFPLKYDVFIEYLRRWLEETKASPLESCSVSLSSSSSPPSPCTEIETQPPCGSSKRQKGCDNQVGDDSHNRDVIRTSLHRTAREIMERDAAKRLDSKQGASSAGLVSLPRPSLMSPTVVIFHITPSLPTAPATTTTTTTTTAAFGLPPSPSLLPPQMSLQSPPLVSPQLPFVVFSQPTPATMPYNFVPARTFTPQFSFSCVGAQSASGGN